MVRSCTAFFLTALCAALPSARALEWPSHSFSGTTAPLQTTLTIAFPFKNTGEKPVTIRDLQTNCDCLSARTDKKIYQPGESGLVTATFAVGDRTGLHQRAISISTDEGVPATRLDVRIDVPSAATAEPRTLDWPIGAESTEQSSDLNVADGLTLSFEDIFATNDAFSCRLETLEAGRRYRLHVRPKSTAATVNAAIRVQGHTTSGASIVVSIYANVR